MYYIYHNKEISWEPIELKEVPKDADKPSHFIDEDGAEIIESGNRDYMQDIAGKWLKRTVVEKEGYTTVGNIRDEDIENFIDFFGKYQNKDWDKGRVVAWFLEEQVRDLPSPKYWTKIEVDKDKELEDYLNRFFDLNKEGKK